MTWFWNICLQSKSSSSREMLSFRLTQRRDISLFKRRSELQHSINKTNELYRKRDARNGEINQSVTPPATASHVVCGENTAIRFSIHLQFAKKRNVKYSNQGSAVRKLKYRAYFTITRSFQVLWLKRLRGAKMGGWYDNMKSLLLPSASSTTASVKSLVSNILFTSWGALGSTRIPEN